MGSTQVNQPVQTYIFESPAAFISSKTENREGKSDIDNAHDVMQFIEKQHTRIKHKIGFCTVSCELMQKTEIVSPHHLQSCTNQLLIKIYGNVAVTNIIQQLVRQSLDLYEGKAAVKSSTNYKPFFSSGVITDTVELNGPNTKCIKKNSPNILEGCSVSCQLVIRETIT